MLLNVIISSLYQSRTQTHFRVTSRWFEMWLTSREAIHKRDHGVPGLDRISCANNSNQHPFGTES